MSLNNLVKRLQDIMRNDAGINGDAQRIEQMDWIDFRRKIWYPEKAASRRTDVYYHAQLCAE